MERWVPLYGIHRRYRSSFIKYVSRYYPFLRGKSNLRGPRDGNGDMKIIDINHTN
jgi:hypothetical protein